MVADGVAFDDSALPAALERLETATVESSDASIVRGEELHRRNGSRWLPAAQLPVRAMLLESLSQFDSRAYERATIEPYLLPSG